MEEPRIGRRERRRRKTELRMEEGQTSGDEFQKRLGNSESSIAPQVSQSVRKLVRRDTYRVLYSKSEVNAMRVGELGEDFGAKDDELRNSSPESGNLTYSLNKDSETSSHCTYNVEKSPVSGNNRPVPAPRRRKSKQLEPEKLSSDTDRDITEIDLDDPRAKLNISNSESSDLIVPIPKPRRAMKTTATSENLQKELKSPPGKSSSSKTEEKDKQGTRQDSTEVPDSKELPLISDLQSEAKSTGGKQKSKKQRKHIGDLLDRKGGKRKTFSSLMKLEKKKIPKISSLLKDLKEDERKSGKPEPEEEKTDFQTESPRYRESAYNGRIYVQGKNGFHVMERDEVLRNGREGPETDGNGGMTENSTVRTAVLFQKFWSRAMIYFHGVLAGIGFSHAATITALMLYSNYEPQAFVALYSYSSLKVHYVFYALTTICIVSCFDRVDIGHMNRKHWNNAFKYPSTWAVLFIYVISFGLTFANQLVEVRFDAFPDVNETEIWEGRTKTEVQVSLLEWYHSVWARDVLVLVAWLLIAVTRFDDFLHSHINNMAKYVKVKGEKGQRRKNDIF